MTLEGITTKKGVDLIEGSFRPKKKGEGRPPSMGLNVLINKKEWRLVPEKAARPITPIGDRGGQLGETRQTTLPHLNKTC